MSLTILRWNGGYAGDIILKLITESNPAAKSNINFKGINQAGKIEIDTSDFKIKTLTELDLIGFNLEKSRKLSQKKLKKELNRLIVDTNVWYIKSHYYAMSEFNEFTIDIVADELSLPFIINANLKKCGDADFYNKKILKIIKDEKVKEKYVIYNIAKGTQIIVPISDNCIPVSSIISGFDSVKQCLAKHGIFISDTVKNFYQRWYESNINYLPSQKYIKYVNTKKYQFDDLTLTFYERYSLLVLANKKFRVLN
jgi:hypothetical protein